MRNVWKGLVVGAVVGSGVGVVLDLIGLLGDKTRQVGEQGRSALREHAPEVADAVAAKAADVTEYVKQADIPGRVREMTQHAVDSPPARAVAEKVHAAGEAIGDAARHATAVISDKVQEGS